MIKEKKILTLHIRYIIIMAISYLKYLQQI